MCYKDAIGLNDEEIVNTVKSTGVSINANAQPTTDEALHVRSKRSKYPAAKRRCSNINQQNISDFFLLRVGLLCAPIKTYIKPLNPLHL